MLILPTNAPSGWGLWYAAAANGLPPGKTWDACTQWLRAEFGLGPVDARNCLDSWHGMRLAKALTHMTLDEIATRWRPQALMIIAAVCERPDLFAASDRMEDVA